MSLTERLINKISGKSILERLGISGDVLFLTKYIKNKLDKGLTNFTIKGRDINHLLTDIKINKLQISVKDLNSKMLGYIDPYSVKLTKDGVIGKITLHNDDYSVISHEVEHLLQLQYTQPNKKIRSLNLSISASGYKNKNIDLVDEFVDLLYTLSNHEIDAFVYTVLFDISKNLPKNFTNNEFISELTNHDIWLTTKKGVNLDYRDFINNIDEDFLKKTYNNFIYIDKLSLVSNNLFTRILNVFKIMRNTSRNPNQPTINDYEQFFKKWVTWINKQSRKLQNKLTKLYDIVTDIQNEFEYFNEERTIVNLILKIQEGLPLTSEEIKIRERILNGINKITNN